MNKERLNELEKRKPDTNLGVFNQRIDGYSLTKNEFEELIAAARRCNELEAENAALKDVNWDISYPDGESLATIKAERDAMEKHADDVTQMLTMCQAERDALEERIVRQTKEITGHAALHGKYRSEIDTLRADNAALREACKAIVALDPDEFIPKWRSIADEALSATPADSLREYRNGVLEEAANVAKTFVDYNRQNPEDKLVHGLTAIDIEKAIRAMKEADNDTD